MHLLNEIYVDNELVTFDNLLLDPTKNKVDGLGYMEDYTHLGSCYFIHPEVNQSFIDDVYDHIKHYQKYIIAVLALRNCQHMVSVFEFYQIKHKLLSAF